MNDSIKHWLAQSVLRPGIVACGIRSPHRHCYTETNSPDFTAESLNDTWHRLAEVTQGLTLHRIQSRRMRWGYENVDLHFVVRPDGASLGMLTYNGLAAPDPDAIEEAVAQFYEISIS